MSALVGCGGDEEVVSIPVAPPGGETTDGSSIVFGQPRVELDPGATTELTLLVTLPGPGRFVLEARGLPPGATASFNPPEVTDNQELVVLSLTAGANTPAGTFPVSVVAIPRSGARTEVDPLTGGFLATFDLIVDPTAPSVRIKALEFVQTVTAGDTANFGFELTAVNGFQGVILAGFSGGDAFNATARQSGVQISDNAETLRFDGTNTIIPFDWPVQTSTDTAPGTYTLRFLVREQGDEQSLQGVLVQLVVLPASSPSPSPTESPSPSPSPTPTQLDISDQFSLRRLTLQPGGSDGVTLAMEQSTSSNLSITGFDILVADNPTFPFDQVTSLGSSPTLSQVTRDAAGLHFVNDTTLPPGETVFMDAFTNQPFSNPGPFTLRPRITPPLVDTEAFATCP